MKAAAIAIGLVWAACAPGPLPAGPRRGEPCRPVEGAAALLAPGRIIVLGELHGTVEVPAGFGDLVCAALAGGHDVRVGFELSPASAPAFARYLASDGGPAARAELAGGALRLADGRGSEAMLALVERLRRWRAGGAGVAVFAFKERGDEQFAVHVAAVARAAPRAVVLALVGQEHARVRPESAADAPMSWNLRQAGLDVVALDVTHAGGTAWNVTADGPGAHAAVPTEPDAARRPGIRLGGDADYDGTWFVGPIRASPPAAPM